MDHAEMRQRLCLAFKKMTEGALVLSPDAKSLSAEEAQAAASLAQAILAIDAAKASICQPAANKNEPKPADPPREIYVPHR